MRRLFGLRALTPLSNNLTPHTEWKALSLPVWGAVSRLPLSRLMSPFGKDETH